MDERVRKMIVDALIILMRDVVTLIVYHKLTGVSDIADEWTINLKIIDATITMIKNCDTIPLNPTFSEDFKEYLKHFDESGFYQMKDVSHKITPPTLPDINLN